jgi:hypothetical protein
VLSRATTKLPGPNSAIYETVVRDQDEQRTSRGRVPQEQAVRRTLLASSLALLIKTLVARGLKKKALRFVKNLERSGALESHANGSKGRTDVRERRCVNHRSSTDWTRRARQYRTELPTRWVRVEVTPSGSLSCEGMKASEDKSA